MKHVLSGCWFLLFLLLPSSAWSHTGLIEFESVSFWHGFNHPLHGLDHLLAMFAVGFIAAQAGKKALWAVPLAFISAMMLGGILAFSGVSMPFVEPAILLSVLLFGLSIALAPHSCLPFFGSMIGLFAVFHGFAHGAEMPLSSDILPYAAGFVSATVMLHLVGIGAGAFLKKNRLQSLSRITGGAIALGGLLLAAG